MLVIEPLKELLLSEFKPLFEKIGVHSEQDILNFANKIIKEIIKDTDNMYAKDFNILLTKIYDRRRSKRNRLIAKAKKIDKKENVSLIQEEVSAATRLVKLGSEDTIKKYNLLHKSYSKEEVSNIITQNIMEELEVWRKNHDASLHDFRYFKTLKDAEKERALCEDMQLFICKYISNDLSYLEEVRKLDKDIDISENTFPNTKIILFPNNIGQTPFANKSSVKLKLREINNLLIDSYDLGDGIVYKTKIPPSTLKEEAFYKAYYTCFNVRTRDILDCLFANVGADFLKDGKVDIELKTLVDYAYSTDNAHSYEAVKAELYKLRDFNITIRNEQTGEFSYFSLFSKMEVKGSLVHVTFGEVIKEQFINNQVTILYKETLKKLKQNSIARILIVALQSKRISVFYQEDKKLDITGVETPLPLIWFREKVRFSNNKQSVQIQNIKTALEEIHATGEIIEKWRYSSVEKCFYISFKKVEKREEEELFKRNGKFISEVNYKIE